jgi:hypothetical protein
LKPFWILEEEKTPCRWKMSAAFPHDAKEQIFMAVLGYANTGFVAPFRYLQRIRVSQKITRQLRKIFSNPGTPVPKEGRS